MTILGRPLLNASGDIDVASTGFKYLIDTMTHINAKIITQRFFEIAPADYIPLDVGQAAWKSEIVQNMELQEGGSFEDGFVNNGGSRVAQTDVALAQNRMPTATWRKKAHWNIGELAEAANSGNWDIVEAKLRSLKKNWDLGVQYGAFNGFNVNADMTGLLNNSSVNINTTLITKKISEMDASEFQTFVANLLNTYYANTNNTLMFPSVFMIPAADFLGLGAPVSSSFPNVSKMDYLTEMFTKMQANIKIVPMVYCESTKNPEGKDRYVLYNNDPDTLKMTIPVDLRMNQAYSVNGFDFEQMAYGQISGVMINRPREVLYCDLTAAS